MRFSIPQFIEHEAKIIGPLTFKQFIFVGVAGVICFVLYFTVSFTIFLISCFVFGGIALAFAFLKIGGIPFPSLVGNFLRFSLSPKLYLWKKRGAKEPSYEEKIMEAEKTEEKKVTLKIGGQSQLSNIKTRIETENK